MIQSENFIKKKILFVFDLDGVLIDSKPNMKFAWNMVRKKFNIKAQFDQYFQHIGIPFSDILSKLDINQKQNEIEEYFILNSLLKIDEIQPFPNVVTTLKKLKKNDKKIGVLTSKDIMRTKKIIKKLNLVIDIVMCPEKNKPGKPNPFQFNEILEKNSINKKDAVYIGDMYVDYLTAQNADVEFIFAEYGYGKNVSYKHKIKDISNILKL